MSGEDWQGRAACLGTDPDVFFPGPGGNDPYGAARKICSECPVVEPCLEEAMIAERDRSGDRFGMFGGLRPGDRIELERGRRILNGAEVAA